LLEDDPGNLCVSAHSEFLPAGQSPPCLRRPLKDPTRKNSFTTPLTTRRPNRWSARPVPRMQTHAGNRTAFPVRHPVERRNRHRSNRPAWLSAPRGVPEPDSHFQRTTRPPKGPTKRRDPTSGTLCPDPRSHRTRTSAIQTKLSQPTDALRPLKDAPALIVCKQTSVSMRWPHANETRGTIAAARRRCGLRRL